VALEEAGVRLDTSLLKEAMEREAWEEASQWVRGPFLEGFGVPDASGFEDWITVERRYWLQQSVLALAAHAEFCGEGGDVARAGRVAGKAVALDPLSDAAHRAAIRATALSGERAAALALYEEFAGRLRETLGAEPQPETTRLADRVRRERSWRLPDVLSGAEKEARRAPLVGRERTLAEALNAWNSSHREARPAVITLEGEPGIGKTRLAEEIAARARLDGAVVLGIRCVPSDLEAPWSGLVAFCRSELLEAPGIVFAPPGALAAIAEEVPEWRERFEAEIGDSAPLPLARAFGGLARAVVEEQPLLLFVDDAEWLDDDSARALAAVLRDLGGSHAALLLAAPRPGARAVLEELRDQVGRDYVGCSLVLDPLSETEIRRLASHVLPSYAQEQLDRLTRRVEADSAGLPLLVVELCNAVRLGLELGALQETWPAPDRTLDQTIPGDLPDALVAAIRIGFRRLSSDAQTALAAASVLGERVDVETLERATGTSADALLDALDELEWQRWLAAEPRGYAFVARVVRKVIARDMLTPGQRRRIETAAGIT